MSSYREFRMQSKRRKAKKLFSRVALLVLILLLLFAAIYVGVRAFVIKNKDENSDNPADNITQVSDPGAVQEEANLPIATPVVDKTSWNTVFPVNRTINDVPVVQDAHMLALPQNGRVTKEFFRNSLFIGDSLTQGLMLYGDSGLNGIAMVHGFRSASPKTFVDNSPALSSSGQKVPPLDEIFAQPLENVHSVYILLGTNALPSQKDEAIMKYYSDLLPILQSRFLPGTIFYVQGMPPVTAATAVKRPEMSNERIRILNNAIAQLAVQNKMNYIDLQEVFADAAGNMPDALASPKDGFHLHDGTGYAMWIDYLQRHTVYDPRHAAQYEAQPSAS